MNHMLSDLKSKLKDEVKQRPAPALLFSGGLDSSLLASIDPCMTAIHVTLGIEAPDLPYALELAKVAGLTLVHVPVTVDEAVTAIPEVIGILESFDPAIPNDLAAWFGLKKASELGFDSVMTGDGADELFAGYDFIRDLQDADAYLSHMAGAMTFSSNRLGASLGLEIVQPFLRPAIKKLAGAMTAVQKIQSENGTVYGKWPLRKAFEGELPAELIWQSKRPLEVGSGMTALRQHLHDQVSPESVELDGDGVKFYGPEHYYYYRVYRQRFGRVTPAPAGERSCPGCAGVLPAEARHCRVCGWAGPADG